MCDGYPTSVRSDSGGDGIVIGNGLMQNLSPNKSPLERGGRGADGVCLPYNPKLKSRARELRNNSTLSEVLLWNQPIEIDGRSHNGKYEYDKKRQAKIESYGVKFLRFSDEAIKKRLNAVLENTVVD